MRSVMYTDVKSTRVYCDGVTSIAPTTRSTKPDSSWGAKSCRSTAMKSMRLLCRSCASEYTRSTSKPTRSPSPLVYENGNALGAYPTRSTPRSCTRVSRSAPAGPHGGAGASPGDAYTRTGIENGRRIFWSVS